MGVSTDGQLCYGLLFEEETEFPWSGEKYEDAEEWWREVRGYREPFVLFDEQGNYLNGVEPPEAKVEEYFDHRNAWDKEHPLPLEEVNYCSGSCPAYILAVPGSVRRANRGFPTKVTAADLPEMDASALLAFCDEFGLTGFEGPHWYLSSYWSS